MNHFIKTCSQSILLGLLVAVVSPLHAGTEAGPVDRLSQLLGAMEAVTGEFDQVIRDESGEIVEENRGSFALKRPNLFRWHVAEPFEKLMISNGETLWTYDPELEQVTIEPLEDKLLQSPMLLFSGDAERISERYAVTRPDDPPVKLPEGIEAEHFALTPRTEDPVFERLTISFADGRVSHMVLHNTLGEAQTYVFSELRYGAVLPETQFNFEPPPGVDVLTHE